MGQLRKQRLRKKFRYVNRSRLSQKRKKTAIKCEFLKKEWDHKASIKTNMTNMGLSYDPNITLGMPKSLLKPLGPEETEKMEVEQVPTKGHVAKILEDDAKAPRVKLFRLPNCQVRFITQLLDKYGENYKGMQGDPRNYYQLTWKQLRAKVKQFKNIPEQYEEYLKSKEPKEPKESPNVTVT